MIQATISADIVSSSSLTVDEKVRIIANIRSFLADLELQSLGQCWGRIVKGDAVEIYCAEIAGLLNIKQSAVNQHSTVLITFICSWLFSFMFGFWWAALLIAILHGVVDGLKSLFGRIPWVFFIDPFLHIVIIISVSVLYNSTLWAECLSPSIDTVVVFMPEWVENPVVLWATAYVFCIKPAKLRFNGRATERSEYVLTGTLLSFGMAIMVGVLVKWLSTFMTCIYC